MSCAQEFPKLEKSMLRQMDNVLSVDIPSLMKLFENPYHAPR